LTTINLYGVFSVIRYFAKNAQNHAKSFFLKHVGNENL
jgi:hypothetical protein